MRKYSYIPIDWSKKDDDDLDLIVRALNNFGLTLSYFKSRNHFGFVLYEVEPEMTDEEYKQIKIEIVHNLRKLNKISLLFKKYNPL